MHIKVVALQRRIVHMIVRSLDGLNGSWCWIMMLDHAGWSLCMMLKTCMEQQIKMHFIHRNMISGYAQVRCTRCTTLEICIITTCLAKLSRPFYVPWCARMFVILFAVSFALLFTALLNVLFTLPFGMFCVVLRKRVMKRCPAKQTCLMVFDVWPSIKRPLNVIYRRAG